MSKRRRNTFTALTVTAQGRRFNQATPPISMALTVIAQGLRFSQVIQRIFIAQMVIVRGRRFNQARPQSLCMLRLYNQ